MVHDVTEPIQLEVDQIYHLACPASPPHYQYNPVKTIKTSTMGTLNMLGLAKRVRARMLLTSTSEIYGDPQVHPQPESYWGNVNTIGPRSCYDEGKRVAETMVRFSFCTIFTINIEMNESFHTVYFTENLTRLSIRFRFFLLLSIYIYVDVFVQESKWCGGSSGAYFQYLWSTHASQ